MKANSVLWTAGMVLSTWDVRSIYAQSIFLIMMYKGGIQASGPMEATPTIKLSLIQPVYTVLLQCIQRSTPKIAALVQIVSHLIWANEPFLLLARLREV